MPARLESIELRMMTSYQPRCAHLDAWMLGQSKGMCCLVWRSLPCVLHSAGANRPFPVCAQILTPVQNARCIVRAYPYVPDSAALATCLAARCGCQSARERLSVKRQTRVMPI